MTYLRWYIFIVDIVIGISAFAALFHSSFGVAEKTFFALALLLLAFMIEVSFLQSDTLNANLPKILFAAIQALEKRIEGQDTTIEDAAESKRKELKIQTIAEGKVNLILITARFGGWIIGGWLVERLLLPHL